MGRLDAGRQPEGDRSAQRHRTAERRLHRRPVHAAAFLLYVLVARRRSAGRVRRLQHPRRHGGARAHPAHSAAGGPGGSRGTGAVQLRRHRRGRRRPRLTGVAARHGGSRGPGGQQRHRQRHRHHLYQGQPGLPRRPQTAARGGDPVGSRRPGRRRRPGRSRTARRQRRQRRDLRLHGQQRRRRRGGLARSDPGSDARGAGRATPRDDSRGTAWACRAEGQLPRQDPSSSTVWWSWSRSAARAT